jgi:hypothetical protein
MNFGQSMGHAKLSITKVYKSPLLFKVEKNGMSLLHKTDIMPSRSLQFWKPQRGTVEGLISGLKR